MNVKSKEKKEDSTFELVIEVGAEEFENALDKVYRKSRGKIAVPGFRKGKAPRKVIEGMYGSGVFYEEAVDALYPDALAQAVEQEKLDMVAYPKVDVLEVGKNGFAFKAVVTVKPEASIGDYKGLTAEKEEPSVTDEDVENELKPFIQRATRLVAVDREAKVGDTVVIDFEGFDDGKAFEGGKGENYPLELGSNSFIPGFEDALVGSKAGDEKDLDITFPEDYGAKELAGKAVVFKVKVHEVKESEVPEVDDEFAKDVSEFETLVDFKKDLEEKLMTRRKDQAERTYVDTITEKLIALTDVKIPDAMVDYRAEQILNEYVNRITSQGISIESFMQMTGENPDMLKKEAHAAAEKQIQSELALDAVVAAEKFEITEEEMDDEYAKLAERYKLTEEQAKSTIHADDIKLTLSRRKALELVKASAKKSKPKKASAAKAEGADDAEKKEKPKKRTTRKKAEPKTEE
ncbi:MAG: trigger factor [Intestinimonas sp.]|jgi:trigger factor|nr:trigger factor [Intestinimonas sp.]